MIMKKHAIMLVGSLFALSISLVAQNPKFAPVRTDIPMGGKLLPKEEEPVFAICSKQGIVFLFRGTTERTGSRPSSPPTPGKTVAGTVTIQFTAWLTPRV